MKRSKLCFGLLLASVIMLGLSLSVCSKDTNALKHEYQGLSLLQPAIPNVSHDSNNYIDWNNSTSSWRGYGRSPAFFLNFQGTAWDSSLENLRVRKDLRYVFAKYDDTLQQCVYNSQHYDNGFMSVYTSSNLYSPGLSSSRSSIAPLYGGTFWSSSSDPPLYTYVPDAYTGNKRCRSRSGMLNVDPSSFNRTFSSALPSWPNGSDLLAYNVLSVMANDNFLPYWYQTDTLPFKDSHRQSDGVTYTKSFSFDTIFNRSITSFSYLSFNLDEYSGYWYDDQNLYAGRDIDFRFLFRFDSPFTFEQTFLDSGSLTLQASAVRKSYTGDDTLSLSYNCTSTQRQVGESDYYWQIDCPVTLAEDYIIFVPSLHIDGNGNKVFSTTGNWEFSSVYIVTDHDSTVGSDFNDSPTGNTNIWDAYWSDNDTQFNPEDADWFQSLVSLFSFDFINPFAPIFNLFNNDSCAQIPTLASMLHSQETQVCPWFDSTVRNITTPVLGLSSMMLVFGFVVRWLGSRSGNFIEDSGGIDSGGYHFGNKYRRK